MIAFSQLQANDRGIVDCREQRCSGISRKTKITPAVIALLFNESSCGMHLHAYLFPINLGPFFPSPLVVIVWNTLSVTQLPYLKL